MLLYMLWKILFILGILLSAGCEKRQAAASKPIVLVSAPPYLDFVQRIAGDTVTAVSLVPVGANPHVYEPTPKEMQQLRGAALWLRLGEPSDQKAYRVLKQGATRIGDITEGLPLLPLSEGHCCHAHNDLHVWLSPKLAQQQAEMIARHLSALLPENQALYASALVGLLADLHTVDEEIRTRLAPKSGSAILVSHPAFAYFCKEYALEQLSIEVEGKDPLPQDIQTLLERVKEQNIVSVLSEPQYSDKAAKLMAEHLHVTVYEIDPYAPDYLDTLRRLARTIAP